MQSAPLGRRISRRDDSRSRRYLRGAVLVIAVLLVLGGVRRVVEDGRSLFPSDEAGWGLGVLIGLVVAYFLALDRGRWLHGSSAGAALALATLLLYGWLPAVLVTVSMAAVIGVARVGPRRRPLHDGATEALGVGAAALVLAAFGTTPTVERPWSPADWGLESLPQLLLGACAYLLVVHTVHRLTVEPANGARALVTWPWPRDALVALALLCTTPLIAVVAVATPGLLPLFAVPLIVLDHTFWMARVRVEERLLDPLTGLPNRRWLLTRTDAVLREAAGEGRRVGLILIDLDSFRSVNDTLGHLTGDRLLLLIADRIRAGLPAGASAARLGGDEFAILLPHAGSATAAQRTARTLISALNAPLELDGLSLLVEASAGVAVFPEHACEAEGLLRRADVAMYLAKRDRSEVEVYEASRDGNTPDRLALLGDLRRALDAGEVELHYQPKVRFDGVVAGLEALVRWNHPVRGKVPPDEFIAIAEASGLMPRLTEHVLESALRQVARWRAAGLTVPVAVNVSPRDVHAPGFAGAVAARLARHRVPPDALQLEITEHVMLEDPHHAADTLAALAGHGVRMSLDDFGTGYSSLVHLRKLPVSELKIDRSFVARLVLDAQDAEIVRCTVDLAHSLGLVVVAEGVEDDETWERLRDLGCDAVQGWLVAAAMPVDEATSWLRARDTEAPEAERAARALPAGRPHGQPAGRAPTC
ncbi:putative bifunctional diguanylate cyclase/phosphodiesterase [Streptomyces profundus]|uniref:putative bifunctional diguanylate cyclase/phosphodiesterase n=1 Tax=Streptomyces profundus TaxID=2867410 RepID=UPI001D160EB4|nr:bifunctional diguanylate cyclase/phosphodiesterase [Streptomyces sp. MA3_2.13]UED86807.1 bifunctional diguanylate cyclase/phosphodiesterase [Streptomyces sp. MA3_2.13]